MDYFEIASYITGMYYSFNISVYMQHFAIDIQQYLFAWSVHDMFDI